ncbi:hypothetical protein BGY98DRAFT_1100374 [Russula aff. rugulosa BPL654]|nr:hypothetical protein BGY98DRAFT_1100374 [Russula aff. rugulosa BPL654]
MSSGKSALIFGATGQTGRHLLRELIASPTFTRVCEAGRRVTPAGELPAQASGKIEQKVIDFERLEEAGLKEGEWDVVFIAMGTSAKNAGSQENFTKIDKEYVVNAAKFAKTDKEQRLVYLSVRCSFEFLYRGQSQIIVSLPRSKGLTEQALAELGYKDTIVFRPSALSNTKRTEFRFAERAFLVVTGVVSRFSDSVQIDVDKLAKSIRVVGEQGSSSLPSGARAQQTNWGGKNFTLIDNAGAIALSK